MQCGTMDTSSDFSNPPNLQQLFAELSEQLRMTRQDTKDSHTAMKYLGVFGNSLDSRITSLEVKVHELELEQVVLRGFGKDIKTLTETVRTYTDRTENGLEDIRREYASLKEEQRQVTDALKGTLSVLEREVSSQGIWAKVLWTTATGVVVFAAQMVGALFL